MLHCHWRGFLIHFVLSAPHRLWHFSIKIDVSKNMKKSNTMSPKTAWMSRNPHEALHVEANVEVLHQKLHGSMSFFQKVHIIAPVRNELAKKMSCMAVPSQKGVMWSSAPLYVLYLPKFTSPRFVRCCKKIS